MTPQPKPTPEEPLSRLPLIDGWSAPASRLALPAVGEVDLWLMDLAAAVPEKGFLSPDERQRAATLLSAARQDRFIRARGGLRAILASYLGGGAEELRFSYGHNGKPMLESPVTPLQFNLSHSGDLALLAIGNTLPVGIDLEPVAPRRSARLIAQRVFHAEANAELERLEGDRFIEAFIMHWTSHEAVVKTLGNSIFTGAGPSQPIAICSFHPRPGWIASLAMEGTIPPAESWRTYSRPPPATAGGGNGTPNQSR